jgi:hypothetical protein
MFRKYLAERPEAPERREVLQRIDELQKELAAEPPPLPSPPPEPVVTMPSPEPVVMLPSPEPVVTMPSPEPVVTAPSPEPVVTLPSPEPVARTARDWRKDWLGATLCGVGAGALLIGAVDFGVEYPRYSALGTATKYSDYMAALPGARDASPHLTADVILMPVGAVLLVAGAIRYAVLARRR